MNGFGGFTFPLSPAERSGLYHRLEKLGARCTGENLDRRFADLNMQTVFCIACENSRFDARLLGILTDFLAHHFANLNPFEISEMLKDLPTPQTLGIVGEFARHLNPDKRLSAFLEIALSGVPMAPIQAYYNSQTRPRLNHIDEWTALTPQEFRRWGFVSGPLDPYLKEQKPQRSPWTFSASDRKNILELLLRKNPRFRMRDYLELLAGSITRQQAHKDLLSNKHLRRRGKTRDRTYSKRRAAR